MRQKDERERKKEREVTGGRGGQEEEESLEMRRARWVEGQRARGEKDERLLSGGGGGEKGCGGGRIVNTNGLQPVQCCINRA